MLSVFNKSLYHKQFRLMIIVLYIFFASITCKSTLWAYDLINNLNLDDPQYKKLQELHNIPVHNLTLFEYQLKEQETLLSISIDHQFSISALISLNRSASISQYQAQDFILIPSQKGIFLSISPKNDVEFLVNRRLFSTLTKDKPITIKSINKTVNPYVSYFLPNKVLTLTEFNLWKQDNFRFPVLQGVVSSYFGPRISPLSGNKINHKGIDIASSSGSEIFASKSGTIIGDGYNVLFGYYFIIKHDDNYTSLYGHMLAKEVNIGDYVLQGQHIGYMGTTGASTGNHIHFEILKNNIPIDPLLLIKTQ